MKVSLGFSPCPNDAFIFDALVHHKIDTEGLEFDLFIDDVENLNQKAFNRELDITKLSYHAYAYLTESYILLNAGSALGKGCGPLVIADNRLIIDDCRFKNLNTTQCSTPSLDASIQVAVPGKYTTANFLFSLAYPDCKNRVEMLFSSIENAVLSKKVEAGVIIHENRFTYQERGLKKIIDLGEYWENLTGLPIPLGGIVVKRSFEPELKQKIDRVLKRSVQYAFDHPDSSLPYIRKHAQELDDAVTKQHIELYVNSYTLNLGEEGRNAIKALFDKAMALDIIPTYNSELFV